MGKLKTGELLINELFNIDHELIEKYKKYSELRNIRDAEENIIYSKMNELIQV